MKGWGKGEWFLFILTLMAVVTGGCVMVALSMGVHK